MFYYTSWRRPRLWTLPAEIPILALFHYRTLFYSHTSSQIPVCSKPNLTASGLLPPCMWNETQGISTSRPGLLPTQYSLCRSSPQSGSKAHEEDKRGKPRSVFRALQCWHRNVMRWFFKFFPRCYATWITTACIFCHLLGLHLRHPNSRGQHD